MQTSSFLLVSRIGTESLHAQWLSPPQERNFDVLLSAYDTSIVAPSAERLFFEYRKGPKVAGYGEIIRNHISLLREYDYIALFDDDLAIDANSLSQLFDIASSYNLKISQPALDHESYFTYGCLLRHKGFMLRYVTYIEMMCPIFRTDVLLELAPLFDMGFESGIDLAWSNLVHDDPRDFAVIDAAPVHHSRRVGGRKAANGFVDGKRYEHDIDEILRRFGMPWLPCLPYAAVRRDGSYTESRLAFAGAAARLITAVFIRFSIKWRLRPIAIYWNHLLRRTARNADIDWPD